MKGVNPSDSSQTLGGSIWERGLPVGTGTYETWSRRHDSLRQRHGSLFTNRFQKLHSEPNGRLQWSLNPYWSRMSSGNTKTHAPLFLRLIYFLRARGQGAENRHSPQNGSELARLSPFNMPLRDHGEPAIVYTTAIQQEARL